MTAEQIATQPVLRGDVYNARLDPVEGSEQAGIRPVIIVSRDAINAASRVVLAVPCITYRDRPLYPSQTLLRAPTGGLEVDSVALGEQVRTLAKSRLLGHRGRLPRQAIAKVDTALLIALNLEFPNRPPSDS